MRGKPSTAAPETNNPDKELAEEYLETFYGPPSGPAETGFGSDFTYYYNYKNKTLEKRKLKKANGKTVSSDDNNASKTNSNTRATNLTNATNATGHAHNHNELSAVYYPIIPLSNNAGLIYWLPGTQTMHDLLKKFRGARGVPIAHEHTMLQYGSVESREG